MRLQGNEGFEDETSKLLKLFLEKTGGSHPSNFRGVCLEDIAIVEEVVPTDIFLYDIDIADGSTIGALARRSVRKYSKTVRLLRYTSHICYESNTNALFKAYRCPSCDQFIKKAYNMEQHLTTCRTRSKYVFPKNVDQLQETRFDKLDLFKVHYSEDQKLIKNMAIFDFESFCVQEDNLRDTDTTNWIGKHVPISVSTSSNLVEQPIFSCNSNPAASVESLVDAFDGLATQSKMQIKLKFLEVDSSLKANLNQFFSTLNQRRCRREPVLEFEDECWEEEEQNVSTQIYNYKRINFLIYRTTWKDFETFF